MRHEVTESLAELCTVTEDWDGLLEYYNFIASQSWGDAGEAHLQRASLLKTMERGAEAIAACDRALTLLSAPLDTQRAEERRRERYEESLRLKADLLVIFDQPESAVETLLDQVDQLDATRSALRKIYAARLNKHTHPDQAAELFEDAYRDSPLEETLDEWISHVDHWGDPHARASAVRASIKTLEGRGSKSRVAAKRLAQLADELTSGTPLLAIELYQESLQCQVDVDVIESLIEVADERDQYLSLIEGLDYLIPECFEGEYRGLLKLKRAIALLVLKDAQAEVAITNALAEFDGPIESHEDFELLLGWAERRLSVDQYRRLIGQLDSISAFG